MKIITSISSLLLLLLSCIKLQAQTIEFTENKGQWDKRVKFTGKLNDGNFYLQQTGYKMLLQNHQDIKAVADYYGGHLANNSTNRQEGTANKLPEDLDEKIIVHQHAYEVNFLGASTDAAIIPEKLLPSYNNYFIGNDSSKWASHCFIYQAVVYKNLYPGIDVRYYTEKGALKYDIIVKPHADISNLALQFKGVEGLKIKDGNLIVQTSVGDVTELKPYAYQYSEKGKAEISAKYYLTGNTVRFKLGDYERNSTLVIDPTLIFSTFSGSISDNWGYTATYDGAGNFYAGGITFGARFPTSLGAFQTTFSGGIPEGDISSYDIAIIKFNANGSNRMYATYLGGNGNEQPHSLIVDNNGDLIIAGRTNSSNFPTTIGSFGPGGNFDIFITKLNPLGTSLVGSRTFGGKGNDGVNIRAKYNKPAGDETIRRNYGDDARSEVTIDGNNNIYLASCTQSMNDFPVTSGAFQTTAGGGTQDGVLIKTTGDLGTVLFSSFIGGSDVDAAFVLDLNPTNNNIYVAGATKSTDLQHTGSNNGTSLFNSFQGGECDGFVSQISNDGSTQIATVYVGSAGNDLVYGLKFDKFGYPYITGTTTVGFPIVNAAFKSQAGGKQFITKLKPDLSGIEYSTNFGKGDALPDISPIAFLVDRCENVYVSGWGGGTDIGQGYSNAGTRGLSTTPNAIQSASIDNSDFYFFVLKKNGDSQLYGSFFGENGGLGDHVDGGTSRFDKQGVIYQAICANCTKAVPFPTTAGVWSPNNPSNEGAMCNLAAVKIAFELAGIGNGVRSSIDGKIRDTSGCVPLTVDFTDTLALGKSYIWNFGDGSGDFTKSTPSISHTYNAVGVYRVRLISIDSATCNISDTSYTNIRVRNDKALLSFTSLKLLPCTALSFEFTNTSIAPAGKPFNNQSFLWDFGDGNTLIANSATVQHSFLSTGTYNVILNLIDTNYCNSPDADTISLRIAPNVKAQFETPPFGCAPYTGIFTNTSLAGQTFIWNFGDGSPISNQIDPNHTYVTAGNYLVKLNVIDTSTCNKADSTNFTIIVSPKPTSTFSFSPLVPSENTPITFSNSSFGGTKYKWIFGDGDSLITIVRDTLVQHNYNKSGIYNVCLVAYNDFGCTDTSCLPVRAIVIPLLDVPNAFTPNGDGINDQVTVKGYGIAKLNWQIYNRWGTLVYQSSNLKTGWDGRYKGVLQPQEVYTYILDVQFSDGTKYQKKGDITLLR